MNDKNEEIEQEGIRANLEKTQQILEEYEKNINILKTSVILSKLSAALKANAEFIEHKDMDDFMIDEFWNPYTRRLNELTEVENNVDRIHVKETIKFCKRLLEKGKYTATAQGKRFEITALKKVFCINTHNFKKCNAISLYKDILKHDYSIRHKLILDSLSEYADISNPSIKSDHGIEVYRIGLAMDDKSKVLYDYLMGQLIDAGASASNLILREDLLQHMSVSRRGDRFEDIKNSLDLIATQRIRISDENATDKNVKKKIIKKVSETGRKNIKDLGTYLMKVDYIEVDGELAISIDVPLMKYFSSSDQFQSLIKSDILKHWKHNPRIYWIAKEIAKIVRMNAPNKSTCKKPIYKTDKLRIHSLITNIGELDRYNNFSNQRVYCKRLYKDIMEAIKYIESDIKIECINFSPTTIRKGASIDFKPLLGEKKQ